jgi:DNA-binding CsgD family transcriptional regulator
MGSGAEFLLEHFADKLGLGSKFVSEVGAERYRMASLATSFGASGLKTRADSPSSSREKRRREIQADRINQINRELLSRLSPIVAASLEALEFLNIGLAITNASRRVLFANHCAKQVLRARDGIEVSREGVLNSLHRCGSPSLREIVWLAASSRRKALDDFVFAVRRPSGKRPLNLLIRPLGPHLPDDAPHDTAVLILLSDPDLPLRDTEARLRQLYRLTGCEARLANLLMEGKTIEDCCEQLKIRPSTARMHLGNVFAKTGVQRQGQLVALLWKTIGIIHTKGELPAPQPEGICVQVTSDGMTCSANLAQSALYAHAMSTAKKGECDG